MDWESRVKNVVELIRRTAKRFGVKEAFFVGGYPRSIAMGLGLSDVHDLDVATSSPGKSVELAGWISEAGKGEQQILHRTMAVTVEINGVEIDFQGPTPGAEFVVPYLHDIGVDATPLAINIYSRDFTINSLAMPLDGMELIDMTERSIRDIRDERISSVMPPETAVPGNPLMITRAVRFSQKYGFEIEDALWEQMKKNAGELKSQMSPERLAIEAFTLSKYDPADMLNELGIGYLADPGVIAKGRTLSEE